jgi:16S rRNA (cytosine1402-N4)-methyltransferase
MEKSYHVSVLLLETIQSLGIKEDGIYVDLTFGGGGHSRAILNALGPKGKLFAFDQDASAQRNAIEDARFQLIQENFANAAAYLQAVGVFSINGMMADLGVSSYQLDEDEKGFSYRQGISLDMRMDQRHGLKASDILNTYSEVELKRIFQDYGEVRNAKTLAKCIVERRQLASFEISDDLNEILHRIRFGDFEKYAAPIYQALRIEVNDEMGTLKQMMRSMSEIIAPEGRMSIITFHSLEDRLVKNFMKNGDFTDTPETDLFGKKKPWDWKLLTKKPIEASSEEISVNSRSRSAKLRVIEKK